VKTAIIRWNNKGLNVKRHKQPMQIPNVVEIGEGPNFIHIFVDGEAGAITEVNLHNRDVESITVFVTPDEPAKSGLVGPNGKPPEDDGSFPDDGSDLPPPIESELPN
jgi:hypothetical protein